MRPSVPVGKQISMELCLRWSPQRKIVFVDIVLPLQNEINVTRSTCC